ncbi:MAG: UDP-N-acetylmuramoyl-tripeptide--D-alanyl-D-alanine ligase [Trueperaceae bacterium]|nr:UDP-N-acetylmuramoyl-tripeptide--D-alanyl-D-alanine ligase [Trueperaceae bacterium]
MLDAPTLARIANTPIPESLHDLQARGVRFHSDRVREGDLFFALPGAQSHGIAFADDALARGAVAVVSDRAHPRGVRVADPGAVLLALGRYARAQLAGPVLGVTGSAGKTSTKAMLAAALAATVSPGNMNTPFALAGVLVDCWLGGKTGADDVLVLELGIDHVGEMASLVELVRPSHALLTLIAASHLSGLGDLAGVAREKLTLVHAAPQAWVSEDTRTFLSPALRERVSVYGLGAEADVRGTILSDTSGSGSSQQTIEIDNVRIVLPYPGVAMAKNAVGAFAVARALGVEAQTVAARLAGVRLEPGRLQRYEVGDLVLLDDSYNSNPASATLALGVLRQLPGPRTAILGDMLELGEKSAAHHRELGVQTRDLDRVIAVGTEATAIREGNPHAEHFATVEAALATLRADDLHGSVLVKASRGMRFERIVTALREDRVAR